MTYNATISRRIESHHSVTTGWDVDNRALVSFFQTFNLRLVPCPGRVSPNGTNLIDTNNFDNKPVSWADRVLLMSLSCWAVASGDVVLGAPPSS